MAVRIATLTIRSWGIIPLIKLWVG